MEADENGYPVVAGSPIKGVSRRAFLAALGYTAAGMTLISCRVPEQKIIPNLKQPPEQTPGVSNWYASTCGGCSAGCGTLVKVRDGRPIKLEGNPIHPVSQGGLCSVAHSLVFGLYDSERLRNPLINGEQAKWQDIDRQIIGKLGSSTQSGGRIRFLSNTIISPTSRRVIDKFLSKFEGGRHIVYEPISTSAIRIAHSRSHGRNVTPAFHFDKARLVVSFDADFLGTWISPVQFTRDYTKLRDLRNGQQEMSRHIQFESRMSLTGANADKRFKISSAEQAGALLLLLNILSKKGDQSEMANSTALQSPDLSPQMAKQIEECAGELLRRKGESLVVCGSNDPDTQQIINAVNQTLSNYGSTIDIDSPSRQDGANDKDFAELVGEMNNGEVDALFMLGVNPAYDYHQSQAFAEGLKKVPLKVSFSSQMDETASLADIICPDHHSLESWNDAEAQTGTFSFHQPTIAPLFGTRAYQESLMRWTGDDRSYYDLLRSDWESTLFEKQTKYKKFDDFWDRSLHDGVYVEERTGQVGSAEFKTEGLSAAADRIRSKVNGGFSLELYQKPSIRDGKFASSPWLQELPDPISKTSWDNYACVSPQTAAKLNLAEGQIVKLGKETKTLELPVMIQPGQSDNSVAVALGYGRTKAGKAGTGVGANAFPLVEFADGSFRYQTTNLSITSTPDKVEFAKTQITDSAYERPLIEMYTLADYISGIHDNEHKDPEKLFDEHDYPEHKWGMAVDLSSCTGCNACVLSCQAENNIPVVGKDEIRSQRDLHWLRIDRYYKEEAGGIRTDFQPIPCMQCDNASCESVCPVLATVHSSEGLNMQVYNRCVGTRYCANNCPYKVRRFNWFEYPHDDPVANLALNPDVTVRSRGVMEKCTFCVQRIEEKKILARNENRPIKDGEIQTACQQSCPADAIVFGDLKDLKSRVSENKKSGRNYALLQDLNLKPAVTYLAKVKNDGGEKHGES